MSAWFNPSAISAYTLARTSQINGLFTAVQVAFDKLPDPSLIQQNRIGYVVDAGTTNALAVAMPITLASYAAGICLRVKVLNSNTGPATINVDGLGAVAIKRADGSSLVGAELLAGSVVDLTYDGTVFRLPPVIVALTPGDIATITAGLAANYEPKITAGSSGQYWRYDKTWATLDKTAVGLSNVDNVADANKPISTAQQNALNLKLDISVGASTYFPLSGGAVTGNMTISGTLGVTGTLSAVNNATVGGTLGVTGTLTASGLVAAGSMTIGGAAVATQSFVTTSYAPLASPALTGNPTAPTPAPGDNDTSIATTAFVAALGALKADLASPTFTGNPAAPTQAAGDKSTKLATTAFVRTPGIQSVTSAATVTPTFADDQVNITAQAAALNLANPTGTAQDGAGIVIRIKDNGTARAITYGTQYRAFAASLPSTTIINKTLYLGMIYNAADTKWDVVSVIQEP